MITYFYLWSLISIYDIAWNTSPLLVTSIFDVDVDVDVLIWNHII